jgi:hypothetical protein
MPTKVLDFAAAARESSKAKTVDGLTVLGMAIANALPRINPRMRKHELAALLEILAEVCRGWSCNLREGPDGFLGED